MLLKIGMILLESTYGLETIPIQSWTKPFWERASKNGKVLKAHAGEFGPAENVLYAIKELKVREFTWGSCEQ